MYTLNGEEFTDEDHSTALSVIAKEAGRARGAEFSPQEVKEWQNIKLVEAMKLPKDDGFDYVLGVQREQARRMREACVNNKAQVQKSPQEKTAELQARIAALQEKIEAIEERESRYHGEYISVHINTGGTFQVRQRRGDRITICSIPDLDLANKIARKADAIITNVLKEVNHQKNTAL